MKCQVTNCGAEIYGKPEVYKGKKCCHKCFVELTALKAMRTITVTLTQQELEEILHEGETVIWAEKNFDIEITMEK